MMVDPLSCSLQETLQMDERRPFLLFVCVVRPLGGSLTTNIRNRRYDFRKGLRTYQATLIFASEGFQISATIARQQLGPLKPQFILFRKVGPKEINKAYTNSS